MNCYPLSFENVDTLDITVAPKPRHQRTGSGSNQAQPPSFLELCGEMLRLAPHTVMVCMPLCMLPAACLT